MNPEQQQIELAKLDGWEEMWIDDRGNTRGFNLLYAADGKYRLVPDYLSDLNAVYELEGKFTSSLIYTCYLDNLCIVCNGDNAKMDGSYNEIWFMTHATAAQRCEAILRVKGLWK